MTNEKIHACSSCGGPVKGRRPSRTGLHYCPQRECQAQKSRDYYHSTRAAKSASEHEGVLRLVHALAHIERQQCPGCGLTDALPGFKHRDRSGAGCEAMGPGRPGVTVELVDAIWPEPSYAEVPM